MTSFILRAKAFRISAFSQGLLVAGGRECVSLVVNQLCSWDPLRTLTEVLILFYKWKIPENVRTFVSVITTVHWAGYKVLIAFTVPFL